MKTQTHVLVGDDAFEQLATGFSVTEGPVWNPAERHLLFTDLYRDAIYRLDEFERLSIYRQPSNVSNGLTFDANLRLIACEHITSRVTRTELDGSIVVLASHYDGRELNSPNDVIVAADGDIYFTDPPYGRSASIGIKRSQELDFQGVFRLGVVQSRLELLAADFDRPNGLCFSPDESTLYVNDTARMHIRAFNLRANGTVSGGDVFFTQTGSGLLRDGVPDGMKVDEYGNLYCTGPEGIWVMSPDGKHLGTIRTPIRPTNFAWGGEDLRDLYVTGQGGVCRARTHAAGFAVPHLATASDGL